MTIISTSMLNSFIEEAELNAQLLIPLSALDKSLLTGKFIRVGTLTKPKSKNGWLKPFFNLNNVCIVYGNFELGCRDSYVFGKYHQLKVSPGLVNQFKRNQVAADVEKLNILQQLYTNYMNFKFLNGNHHPYLLSKGFHNCTSFNSLKVTESNQLVIPLFNSESKFMGYQLINRNGSKYFEFGTQLAGSFFSYPSLELINVIMLNTPIRKVLVFIGEGVATVFSAVIAIKSIQEFDPEILVVGIIAFSAYNLEHVIRNLPFSRYFILVDNDSDNKINTGIVTAHNLIMRFPDKKIIPILLTLPNNLPGDVNDWIQNKYKVGLNGHEEFFKQFNAVYYGASGEWLNVSK